MTKLSEYVRDVVSRKGLSSSEVQKRSRNQISFGYVNDIINERTTNPSVEKLQALARGLGVPEDDLFRVARGLPIEEVANPIEVDLVEKFKRLSKERQDEILALLDFYDARDTEIKMGADWAAEEALPDVLEINTNLKNYSPGEGD